eukprot:scaffold4364_cov119-Isochrysis_galbana.AAC.3
MSSHRTCRRGRSTLLESAAHRSPRRIRQPIFGARRWDMLPHTARPCRLSSRYVPNDSPCGCSLSRPIGTPH